LGSTQPTGDASSAETALRRDDTRRRRYRKSHDLDNRADEAADLTRVAERLAMALPAIVAIAAPMGPAP
jgi:hypothetical protein